MRFLESPHLRSRAGIFIVILALHAALTALLLTSRARERVAPTAPLEVQIISVAPSQAETAPQIAPPALERPHLPLITPELPMTISTLNAPAVASSAPAVAAVEAVAVRALPGPPEPLTPPRFDAAYLKNPPPVYPAASRRLREQGTVLMRVRVSPQGVAVDVLLERSSGSPRLDQDAMEAVRHWRFVPAQRGAEPAEAWVLVPVEFELQR